MAVTLIRTLIIFTALFIVMRLMGKRQIGEMQPYEFIITLIIADLACVPMSDVSIPLTYGIVSILELFVVHQVLSIIESKGNLFKKIISGKPSIVINKNGVNLKELKSNNMDINDLIESMRSSGYFSLDDLDYAIFESNGKLSALESQTKKISGIALLVINDGKIEKANLNKLKITAKEILDMVENKKSSVKKTEVMTIDSNGKVYLKAHNKKFTTFNIELNKDIQW